MHPPIRRSTGRVATAMALVVTVCGLPATAFAVEDSPVAAEPAVLGTGGAAVPVLEWGPCPEGTASAAYECATAAVPLSYQDPHGERIEVAVGRLPAADPENRIGSLFFNPGGPGGSGRIPPVLAPELHERFDLVGFDPRGVADSTPLRCFADVWEAADSFGHVFPTTPSEERRVIEATRTGTDACAEEAGPVLDHMSTANVARDLDLLRAAVGDEQLTFHGFSYGTHLGAVYANLFPDRVRAMTLDGGLDPVAWTTGASPADAELPYTTRIGSAAGAQRALSTFLDVCAEDERCAFREPGVDLREKYDRVLDAARTAPIEVPDEDGWVMEWSYPLVVGVVGSALYDARGSAFLGDYLQSLVDAVEGRAARGASAAVTAVAADVAAAVGGQERYAGPEQNFGVACLDSDNPSDPARWSEAAAASDREAPGFGAMWTYESLPCATWPGVDEDRYQGPWDRPTANPVLVLGNRLGDPATPYEGGRELADLLGDGRLLSLDAFGHGAFGLQISDCVDAAVIEYYLGGEPPADGTVCAPDRTPFDPIDDEAGVVAAEHTGLPVTALLG
ncbi:pimeloyl-ACP methyl ester carboxylesterase [Actinoalloteichus hoggarensis]|uniref:Tripeptidyl aminopeptidase n=1 Tax=Actinoalloteichus hoggarensis TaxID=1470176 RepID=A0A221W6J4_9PSEU|nr:alpha/beta hydrolase [Actinoalloteichus hoggarensis]ASO21027.1 Tripeptidyl aminopeptidase precursor [Actinoalloteichus hoggarensis]MBB5920958.1 pimeloyl-ACP methyl ester carboxylesterase [Actinoalloteichus hoggarensis]